MFIALKDIRLAGRKYLAGEEIPEGAVIPSRVTALLRSHWIAEQKQGTEYYLAETDTLEPDTTKISVLIKKTNQGVFLNPQEVSEVFAIMQMNLDEATEAIQTIENGSVLEVLKETDSRKGIKTAAEAKMKEIEMALSEGAEGDDIQLLS